MALPDSNSKDEQKLATPQAGSTKEPGEDKDFDPSAETLVDEIDDERTLEEEEAHADNNQARVQEELDDLKKESEMPIEELLAYYERMRNEGSYDEEESDDDEDIEDDDDEEEENEDEDEDDEDEDGDTANEYKNATSNKNEKDADDRDPGSSAGPGSGGTKRSAKDEPTSSKKPSHETPSNQRKHQSKDHQSTDASSSSPISSNDKEQTKHPSIVQENTSISLDQHITHRESPELNSTSITIDPSPGPNIVVNESDDNLDHEISDSERLQHNSMTDFMLEQHPSTALQSLLGYDLDDSEDDDYSYTSDDKSDDERDWRRSIHVGPEYQADIPEGLVLYDDLPPYQTEDTLVWDCGSCLTTEQILDYLKKSSSIPRRNDITISTASVPRISHDSMRQWKLRMASNIENANRDDFDQQRIFQDVYINQSRKMTHIGFDIERVNPIHEESNHDSVNEETSDSSTEDNNRQPDLSTEDYFQDEEQLLYLLLQCNYDVEEALRRRTLDPFKYYFHEPMSLWSENECLAFEHGLRIYGKNFRQIKENNVATRTHAELVAFYYLWKKSERHDVYTNRYRLDRKRSLTHPGTSDYMDNFIDDNIKLTSSNSPSSPAQHDNSVVGGIDVNVDPCNDSGLATPSCFLSDSMSPQSNTPNLSQGLTNSTPTSSATSTSTQKSLLQIHQPIVSGEEGTHRSSVHLDTNMTL